MRFIVTFVLMAGFLAQAALAESGDWLETYEAGLKRAQEEKKGILISFMGSDWCDQCKKLEDVLLSKESFAVNAAKSFVLVELDFPQTNPELTKKNEPIRVQYGIRGFPVLLATDSEGLPYGEVRMRPDWVVADYLKALADLDANRSVRDDAKNEFETANDDAARVKALEKMLRAVPESSIQGMYGEEFEALRKFSQDKSSLVGEVARKERVANMQNELQIRMAQRRYDDAVALCDEYLSREVIDEGETQMGLTFKYFALMEKKDFEEAAATASALQKVNPKSPIAMRAVGMVKKAELAAEAAVRAAAIASERSLKNEEKELRQGVPGVGESKAPSTGVAKTKSLSSRIEEATQAADSKKHKEALLVLEETHATLAQAEKMVAEAEANLAVAVEAHEKAHQAELKSRQGEPNEEEQTEDSQEVVPSEKEEVSSTEEEVPLQIDQLKERTDELRKKAEELRKQAKELREGIEK